MNDVHSRQFESKLDPYFSAKVPPDAQQRFQRLDASEMRSALATTRPLRASKAWTQGKIGVSSPVRKS